MPVHPIWKLNAFTCFVAFGWGERFLEVGACCVQVVFWKTCGCKSNYKVRNKVRGHPRSIPRFRTPVPYPRSIPPFHTPVWRIRSIPLFHTSLPYLRSIPHDNLLNLNAYTWAHIHTWVHTCACSTYNCYLLCCVMVGMHLATASWQFNNYLLRCSCSKLPILIKMCYLVAVLWSGPFCSRPRSIPFHTRSRPGPPINQSLTHSRMNKR